MGQSAPPAHLVVRGVEKRFGGVHALRGADFEVARGEVMALVGDNGAGKSTMLDALCFGLFQRPFRIIKKDQLINTINEKECVVEVEFVVGTKQYKIIRGIRPNIFEIWCNGDMLSLIHI